MASSNMKDIKRRIKSVESTKQITNAMQLVASSKLRKAKEKADNSKPFFNAMYETMCEIIKEDPAFSSIYTRKSKSNVTLMVVVSGDRGLAGGFNSNVLKLAQQRYDEIVKDGSEAVILPVGKKSAEYFEKRNFKIMTRYENIGEGLTFYGALGIAEKIIDVYEKGMIGRVELFYTDCVSPLVQQEKQIKVIPVDIENDKTDLSVTNYEGSLDEVFDALVPKYLAGVLFGAIVNSFAAEQAARRTAMENATDNANEMLSNLSLVYNRARQAAITQEITEIVSGANAQE